MGVTKKNPEPVTRKQKFISKRDILYYFERRIEIPQPVERLKTREMCLVFWS
jgi:hypothetical protein